MRRGLTQLEIGDHRGVLGAEVAQADDLSQTGRLRAGHAGEPERPVARMVFQRGACIGLKPLAPFLLTAHRCRITERSRSRPALDAQQPAVAAAAFALRATGGTCGWHRVPLTSSARSTPRGYCSGALY
jgi:hypothetical protein